MKINLEYVHGPTSTGIYVTVNGMHAGLLSLRQEDTADFERILKAGLQAGDSFVSTGDPGPVASEAMFKRDFPDDEWWDGRGQRSPLPEDDDPRCEGRDALPGE